MTELTFQIARTMAREWGPGDEIVVTRLDHDGNVRPWVTYAERAGATVRWADFDPRTGDPDGRRRRCRCVTDGTRLVAVTGASNLLGTRPGRRCDRCGAGRPRRPVLRRRRAPDRPRADRHARDRRRLLRLQPVQVPRSAPRRCWPPRPHCSRRCIPDKLRPSTEQVPERFELGTLPYELLAGVTAAIDVLADLVPGDETTMSRRDRLVRSMAALEEYEDALHDRMRTGLESIAGVHLHGHAPLAHADRAVHGRRRGGAGGVPAPGGRSESTPRPGRSTRSRRRSGSAWGPAVRCARAWRRTRTRPTSTG